MSLILYPRSFALETILGVTEEDPRISNAALQQEGQAFIDAETKHELHGKTMLVLDDAQFEAYKKIAGRLPNIELAGR